MLSPLLLHRADYVEISTCYFCLADGNILIEFGRVLDIELEKRYLTEPRAAA